MADERRKGPPDRRRSSRAKPAQAAEDRATSLDRASTTKAGAKDPGQDPNDVARFDAEELDASIREREHEDRGEVF